MGLKWGDLKRKRIQRKQLNLKRSNEEKEKHS